MEIRHIQENDDRLSVSNIYEEGWKFAYRGIVPQDYLDSIPPGRWVPYLDQDGVHSLMMTEDGKGLLSFMILGRSYPFTFCRNIWAEDMAGCCWKRQ